MSRSWQEAVNKSSNGSRKTEPNFVPFCNGRFNNVITTLINVHTQKRKKYEYRELIKHSFLMGKICSNKHGLKHACLEILLLMTNQNINTQ